MLAIASTLIGGNETGFTEGEGPGKAASLETASLERGWRDGASSPSLLAGRRALRRGVRREVELFEVDCEGGESSTSTLSGEEVVDVN